jgi:hypothetical protein
MHRPGTDEQERALDRGVIEFWPVARDYEIRNGVLIPVGPTERQYLPGGRQNLAPAVAKIDQGGDAAILDFARHWGLLGYARLVHANESLSENDSAARLAETHGGDPAPWIRAHAHGIRVCLDLLVYLTSDDPDADQHLEIYLDSIRAEPEHDPTVWHGLRHTSRHTAFGFAYTQPDESIPRGYARTILAEIINPNLRGLTPQLDYIYAPHGLMLVQDFVALIDLAYWQLAQFVLGQLRLARCEECGAYFSQTDKRRRFCPPDEDEDKYSKSRGKSGIESRCAKRARMRRLRTGSK